MTDTRAGAHTLGRSEASGSANRLGQAQLRQVFAAFPTGVAAVAAIIDGEPAGLAANSFVSVSLDPPLVSVCIGHTSTTWPALRTAGRLGISVLGAHQETASRQLSSRDGERFAGLRWRATDNGAVVVCEASAWFDCSVEQEIPAGDHDIVLLRVHDLGASEALPLVFHGSTYRQLQAGGGAARSHDASYSRPAGWAARELLGSQAPSRERTSC
jgi:flavin reductase (DIM6/NTAB) family NADH-FMN oxidoreductase RutF